MKRNNKIIGAHNFKIVKKKLIFTEIKIKATDLHQETLIFQSHLTRIKEFGKQLMKLKKIQ